MRAPFFVLSGLLLSLAGSASAAPQEPTAADLYQEGASRLETREWEAAAAAFEAVLERNPEHVGSWFNLAAALTGLGERTRAIEAYRQALERDPELFEGRMNRAILLRAEGRLGEALEETTRARSLRPGDPVPAMLQGALLEELGRGEEAGDAYRGAADLAPEDPMPQWRLGNTLLGQGLTEEAYRAFLEAERRGMETAPLFVALGNLAAARSDLEAAGRHYGRAFELAPEDEAVRLRLGLVLDESGDYGGAISVLEGLEGVEAVLAEIYMDAGRYPRALETYGGLVAEEPGEVDFWMGLARAAYALDRRQEAIRALGEVVSLDPDGAGAWGMLGAIHHEDGDFARAVPALLRRLELVPGDATSHFLVATALDNLQDTEAALLHYNRFLELDDGTNDARTFQVRRRAELLERLPR